MQFMSAVGTSPGTPTVGEVRDIVAIDNPVIRNLRITECYHRLSIAMVRHTGQCANWCTFATWASRQAGQTIRGEDLLDKLTLHSKRDACLLHPVRALWSWLVRRGLFSPKTRLGRIVHVIHSPFDAFELASDAVARGNQKVFEEIGFQFARYLELCGPGSTAEAYRKFQDGLREGEPPEGQSLLRTAFENYRQKKAQNILLANLLIGVHEQTRLQPEIREAMVAAPHTADRLGGRAIAVLLPGLRPGRLSRLIGFVLQVPAVRFQKYVGDLTCRVVTETMMMLALPPKLNLDLHRNLDLPFTESLRTPQEALLIEFLARFEPAAGAPDDCGALDWSELPQRVHYIIHLFRAFQEREELFAPPFGEDQVRSFMSGKVPRGNL
jgi:hypothetical protein